MQQTFVALFSSKNISHHKLSNALAGIYLFLLFFLLHKPYINEFPSHIHAWAQSDRYALAKGFVDNDLDFFHPQTFVFNKQFPDNWTRPGESRIISVDFPIHDYVPAVFMKIGNTEKPVIFRLYIFIYGLIGLAFLYLLGTSITGSGFMGLLLLLLASTSPVFVYYHSGFLPTIPSLTNAIIAVYYYLKFLDSHRIRQLWLAVIFMTLAGLSRTTFIVPLVAVFCVELYRVLFRSAKLRPRFLPFLVSTLIIFGYKIYNTFLFQTHGSIFLNHLLPPDSFSQGLYFLTQTWKNWAVHYFSRWHYLIFIGIILSLIVFGIKHKKLKVSLIYNDVLFILVWLFGESLFLVVMIRQFSAHDYYFLDTFFLPTLLLIPIFYKNSKLSSGRPRTQVILLVVLVVFSIPMILNAKKMQEVRRVTGYWDRTMATINNFDGTDQLLDSLGVARESKMLVLDAYAPNIPFIQMDRPGYAVMSTAKKYLRPALTWDYDFIIYQNDYFVSDIYNNYPDIIDQLEVLYDNGKITICRRRDTPENLNLIEFLRLDSSNPVIQSSIDFEDKPSANWSHVDDTSYLAYSGTYAGYVDSTTLYGITFKKPMNTDFFMQPRKVLFTGWFYAESPVDPEIAVSIATYDSTYFFTTEKLKGQMRNIQNWNPIESFFQIPALPIQQAEFGVFLWNTKKETLFYDDIQLRVY